MAYVPDIVTPEEEAQLLGALARLPYAEVRMRGATARRGVVHYGWHYGYDTRLIRPAPPVPDFLELLRERAARVAGLRSDELAEVLVTRYPPGAGIGWHRDAPMFGARVVGVSLGGPCILRFRRVVAAETVRWRLSVAPRSAYLLAGAARWSWQHSIPAVDALRFSVSFRTVRDDAPWVEAGAGSLP